MSPPVLSYSPANPGNVKIVLSPRAGNEVSSFEVEVLNNSSVFVPLTSCAFSNLNLSCEVSLYSILKSGANLEAGNYLVMRSRAINEFGSSFNSENSNKL